MSEAGLREARRRMRAAGMDETAVTVFAHYYRQVEAGATGLVPEESIEPLRDVVRLEDLPDEPAASRAALGGTVLLRLNGGLGTSMGMTRAKSLLPVRGGRTFLDLIVAQIRAARAASGARLPLLLMNSFATAADTREALSAYPDLPVADLPPDFLQHRQPKIRRDDLTPVTWPADPRLEWCPPGHGDLYPALHASGVLDRLVAAGFRYACCANADNLGAVPDGRIAAWFAASGAPYAAEVCPRTAADLKGGHLARRRADGRLVLRDTAQTAPEEMAHFTDAARHPYAHTNTLWFDLVALGELLRRTGGVLGLPLIRNEKTVDPNDPASPAVYQLETAVGAAVQVFSGAVALLVGRDRFLPVKTTNDLAVVGSDAYELGADGALRSRVGTAPVVDLDRARYGRIEDFAARFPAGQPSLRHARSLRVRGDWSFGAGVAVHGDVRLADPGRPAVIPDGTVLAPGAVLPDGTVVPTGGEDGGERGLRGEGRRGPTR